MRQRTRWMRLDGYARRCHRPWPSEPSHYRVRIKPASRGLKESQRSFENIVRCSPAPGSEIGGNGPIFGGASRLKWLGHRTEVISESPTFGGGDTECKSGLRNV